MLVKNLGRTRLMLLDSFKDLSNEQINQKPSNDKWSIAQVLHHLYTTEKETAELLINSLNTPSNKVEEKNLSFILDRTKKEKAASEPPEKFHSKGDLVQLLGDSRFRYVQAIFNEIHVKTLEEKSANHPLFGVISLKNLADFIWMHELRHIEQIKEIKQELFYSI